MKSQTIIIVDLGTGNLNSVRRALERIEVKSAVSSSPTDIESSNKIILPGVGHFGKAMDALESLGLRDALDDAVLERKIPVLGICLGLELMARRSEEGDTTGLGWLEAETVRFRLRDKQRYKVPHMGWNTISTRQNGTLLKGIADEGELYFAHSYYLKLANQADLAAETSYETTFPSVVERDNIFGVQFHPEKSHAAGLQILRNFVAV